MQRREFITLLSGAAGPWPRVARAQPRGEVPVVGFLHDGKRELFVRAVNAFELGLGWWRRRKTAPIAA
jgi:hypothetical protein